MECRDIRLWLVTRRDLSHMQEREVQQHLAQCIACMNTWTREEPAMRALRAVPSTTTLSARHTMASLPRRLDPTIHRRHPPARDLILVGAVLSVLVVGLFATMPGLRSAAYTQMRPLLRDEAIPPAATAPTAMPKPTMMNSGGRIDIGGYQLNIACIGDGSPTVVLDAGLGDGINVWRNILPKLGGFTRACAYDRAGIGASDPGPTPRTGADIVQELHTLLKNAGIAGPYVLVGHGLGGLNTRLYAYTYPDQISGLVLIDPVVEEDLVAHLRTLLPPERPGECQALASLRKPPPPNTEGVEYEASVAQLRAAGRLGNIPLRILSRGLPRGAPTCIPAEVIQHYEEASREAQAKLVQLSPQGSYIIAEQSGYYIQIDQPDLVIDSIRQVVEAAR